MSFFASLSGVPIATVSVLVPLYGAWSGDVMLPGADVVPSKVQLVLGNLTMTGTIVRQAVFGGTRRCRLVGGAGGWRKPVSPRQYQHSFGITRATVIGDAAREVGETANVPDDGPIGSDYVRAAPAAGVLIASDVLRAMAPSWYIDPAGVTQVATWPVRSVPTSFQVLEQRSDEGRSEVSTEDYAAWLPGATFASPFTEGTLRNVGSLFRLDVEGKFRLDVLTVAA